MSEPILCNWDGTSLVPATRHMKRCDQELVCGEQYFVEPIAPRSAISHNHQFAWLHTAWLNLPDDLSELYPTETHLRKRALIQAGFYNEQIVDAGSNAGALRVAAYIRNKDAFALVIVRGPFVIERTAKSQREAAMSGKTFQQSKSAIMEVVANMIGVTPDALAREGRAA